MRSTNLTILAVMSLMACRPRLSSADSLTINIADSGKFSIPAMATDSINPGETFAFEYSPPMSRTETFTFRITMADAMTSVAKSMAIAGGINNNVLVKPANIGAMAIPGGSVKVSTTGMQLFTGVSLTLKPGTYKLGGQTIEIPLPEKDIINPMGLKLGGTEGALKFALSFQGNAQGGGTAVVDIGGPGGSTRDISVATMAGESGDALAGQLASAIRSETSFSMASSSGPTVFIPGLSSDNTFGGQLNDGGFSSFTESLSVVPEPSSLVMAGIAAVISLGYAWYRRLRVAA